MRPTLVNQAEGCTEGSRGRLLQPPTNEGRGQGDKGGLPHAHRHTAEQQRHKAWGQAAAHGGDGPDSQADADKSKSVVVFGGLSKHGGGGQQAYHESSRQQAVLQKSRGSGSAGRRAAATASRGRHVGGRRTHLQ